MTEDTAQHSCHIQDAAHPLAVALGLLGADAHGRGEHDQRSWSRWEVLLPHVLAATDHLDRKHAPPAALLSAASWLLDRAGTYLRAHAQLYDALPLFRRALTIAEAAFDPDDLDVSIDLLNLAGALLDQGHPDQARPLIERAMAIQQRRQVASDRTST